MPLMKLRPRTCGALLCSAVLGLAGCSQMPTSGPSTESVAEGSSRSVDGSSIRVVDIDDASLRQLASQRQRRSFAEAFGSQGPASPVIGAGDQLELVIWEAPPAALFGASTLDPRSTSPSSATTLPPQMVDREGFISVPFVGRISVAGQTTAQVAAEVSKRLRGKANDPQVLVRLAQNTSSTVVVVGDVTTNMRLPLTATGERVLEALAAAGGVRSPMHKVTVQITRGVEQVAMPLEAVVRDPRQNIALRPGDVLAALSLTQSFTAMGATGRQEEVSFEAGGITLAQAVARAGGLSDSRADPEGVFVFRFETAPGLTGGADSAPLVYRLNLREARSLFLMQGFVMQDRDILFVSNSPAADLQKFLNLVSTATRQVVYTVDNVR